MLKRKPRHSLLLLVPIMLTILTIHPSTHTSAQNNNEETRLKSDTFKGLAFRSLGPAIMSGRISDIAIHPTDKATRYLAVASGGVWKTTNSGTTWTPIFDDQASYSIGCVTIDPKHPLTIWVGTGENNSQRSVGYGDGIYRSIDGGKSWKNVGLEESEHIAKIVIDSRDSKVIYVAAQGPLWRSGGDRGLYKSTDAGQSWVKVLEISEHTGVTDLVYDPRNPDILLAAAYQRRRHVWTLINGGPESALYRSVDAGQSWHKITNGIPKVEIGRIGLALSPADPDIVYAIVEAQGEKGGFFRSVDGGINWERRSDYMSSSPQYYNEIVADPENPLRVYSMDTYLHRSDDGGKTWFKYPERTKHVDNHALWIDPDDTDHLIAGCDGGLYESWDLGETWAFSANLPITQFYKATPDNDRPFYNIYGGTQDNATQGGPSRTTSMRGIAGSDWFVTIFGDGFKTQIDPTDPNIVYSQTQYGGLARYDRRSGEAIDIQPQPEPGEDPLRWNWDSALIISPHSHTRLYFTAQRVFRSDNRGDSWRPVSPDLTARIDRNRLEVMDQVWSVDAVAKNASTSFYGNIVALTESPLREGLLYAGTDDGLIQITENSGQSWRKIAAVPGVPERTYVNDLEASLHDPDGVYAVFNNHKMGDFKPYVLKSSDRGRSWQSISGDLPSRGSVYSIVEDHEEPQLLFVGTEFGVFFTPNSGTNWVQLKAGIPTIAARDLEIQRRENDLVVGTFGRGFYILDDYIPLRQVSNGLLDREAVLFPPRIALMYVEKDAYETKFQGDSGFNGPNPPFGALISYYLKEDIQTLKELREKSESQLKEEGSTISYPSWDVLRAEDREEKPSIILSISDSSGQIVQRLAGPVEAGFHRLAWNLRYPPIDPVQLKESEPAPWDHAPVGPLAIPGNYTVSLSKRFRGRITELGQSQTIHTETLRLATLPAPDREALLDFQQKVARLQRAVLGAVKVAEESRQRIDLIKLALEKTPAEKSQLDRDTRLLENRIRDVQDRLSGDSTIRKRNEPTLPSIVQRVNRIVEAQWRSTSPPTETNRNAYQYASGLFESVLAELRNAIEVDLKRIESELEEIGAPWTTGRVPRWRPE